MDWDKETVSLLQTRLELFKQYNIVPTLSIIFYFLVSNGIISNSQRDYQNFKKNIYKTQKRYKFSLSNCETKNNQIQQQLDDKYTPLTDYINHEIARLENIPYIYARTIPRWHNQHHYVEIWIEKASLMPTFRSILKERQVRIITINKYNYQDSIEENIKRLISYKERGKKLHINYFGDSDNFYKNIRNIYTNYPKYSLDLDFKKISITKKQIKKFNLPANYKTVKETKYKKINSNLKSLVRKYNTTLKIELDTFPGIAPKEFKKLVLDSVDKFFDMNIFDKSINAYSPVEIRSKIRSQVLKFVKK